MNTTVIQIRTDEKLKTEAQKVASELGFSLSSLIKAFLKNVTRTKSVTFSTSEVPSPWLIKQIKKSQEELKNGDISPDFDQNNLDEMKKWLDNPKRKYANQI
jgi:addiction module RelB/DinJ family antitoxin